jgi:4'-phosphopantetheinyl transferase EntD
MRVAIDLICHMSLFAHMNPAALSAEFSRLFAPGAIVAELRIPGDPQLLLPEEATCVRRAVPKRAQEFAAGRLCARRALAEFGIVDFPIRAAADRQPIWPESTVGSITHTAGLCAAVAARRQDADAVGLDSEVVGDVKAELWPRICSAAEFEWVASLPAADQPAAVTLIFAAKEAFYKCQYPLVRERLNFHDVSIEAWGWGGAEGGFRIHAARRIAVCAHASQPWRGRFLLHDAWVTAGVSMPCCREIP